MPMKCPYRREHEYDAEGLCAHCYAQRAPTESFKLEDITGINSVVRGIPPLINIGNLFNNIFNLVANCNHMGAPLNYYPNPLSVQCGRCGQTLSTTDMDLLIKSAMKALNP